MTFNPAQPRDAQGQWTDAGGGVTGTVVNPHTTTGHNSQFSGVARAGLMGALKYGTIGGVGGGVLQAGVLAASGALPFVGVPVLVGAGVGGLVSGAIGGGIGGGVGAAIHKHSENVTEAVRAAKKAGEKNPHPFWSSGGGVAAKMGLNLVAGVAGAFASGKVGAAAGMAASKAYSTFYGGARGGGFRESTGGFHEEAAKRGFENRSSGTRQSYAEAGIARERQRMAERMAAERARDPMERKLDALRAKAADRGIGDAERRAFQAKAEELLRKHRLGPSGSMEHMADQVLRRHGMRSSVRGVATI